MPIKQLHIAAPPAIGYIPLMPSRDKLAEFSQWCQNHLKGDEKSESQIFPDPGALQ